MDFARLCRRESVLGTIGFARDTAQGLSKSRLPPPAVLMLASGVVNIRPGKPYERAALEKLQLRSSTASPAHRDAILHHPESISLSLRLLAEVVCKWRKRKVHSSHRLSYGFNEKTVPVFFAPPS